MKVAITGHTSGIGSCLFKQYVNHGHNVHGYSRSTGFDIENKDVRKIIVDQSADVDLFINNAYSSTGQTLLLKELIDSWDGKEKKIINISSKLSFVPLGKIHLFDEYIEEKNKQNTIIENRITQCSPQIMNVVLGLVDTPMSSMFENKKLSPEKTAELIYNLSIMDEFYIQQIIIDVPKLDWRNISGPWIQK